MAVGIVAGGFVLCGGGFGALLLYRDIGAERTTGGTGVTTSVGGAGTRDAEVGKRITISGTIIGESAEALDFAESLKAQYEKRPVPMPKRPVLTVRWKPHDAAYRVFCRFVANGSDPTNGARVGDWIAISGTVEFNDGDTIILRDCAVCLGPRRQ